MHKILLVSSKYTSEHNNSYLSNDLAHALSHNQCKVLAIGYGNRDIDRVSADGLLRESIIKINERPKYLKYIVAWPRLFSKISRTLQDHDDITKVIFFAPLSVLWPAVLATRTLANLANICIIFDIYPEHQIQIGSIPRSLSPVLRRIEVLSLRHFQEISAMSPANVSAIQRVYGRHTLLKRFKIIPPWGSHGPTLESISRLKKKPSDHVDIVFGGQICRGRDIGKAIEFLSLLRARDLDIKFTVFTDSKGALFLSPYLNTIPWIDVRQSLPREKYLTALAEFDFGLIVTDPTVTLPTFPSKIIDYLSARLRCLCLLEKDTDLDVMLPFHDIIHVNRFAFDDASVRAAKLFVNKKGHTSLHDYEKALNILSVGEAVRKLLD